MIHANCRLQLTTSDTVRADAWDALHADDPKVEQRLRSVKGLTDNTKAIGDAWRIDTKLDFLLGDVK